MLQPFPSFAAPPVTEVVISSRFRPVDTYTLMRVAELARVAGSSGHSVIEERPGYEAPVERFGLATTVAQVSLEVLSGPPPQRYWFRNEVGDELLQLQPNWFAANWRKVAPQAEYGRWDSRWDAFSRWANAVEASLGDEQDLLQHEQVEVTYVNHIDRREVWTTHAEASRVFSFLSDTDDGVDRFLGEPEQTAAELRFVIPHPEDGTPLGRLHVTVTPVFSRPSNEPIFLMNLTARGGPIDGSLNGVRRFAEIAHEWIVQAFADLTTPEMHAAWERIDKQGATP